VTQIIVSATLSKNVSQQNKTQLGFAADASMGLSNRGSRRWDQVQNIKTRLRSLSPQNSGNTGIRGMNSSLAKVTSTEANYLGRVFVGNGYRINSAGFYISKDGTRLYRPPTLKSRSLFSVTGKQANFVIRELNDSGEWNHIRNGHIDIVD
jgi:hypothetical protein